MNLFLLLGQLGLSYEHSDEVLLPIGTVYDPFVLRGLDAFVYGAYAGSRFIVAGTPSGITLSYEGGAHQSTVTPSVGIGLPGVGFAEPAYGTALDWLLCDGLRGLTDRESGESLYLRLTTRPIDQSPFAAARERLGDEVLRRQVLAGAYRLEEPPADAARWPRVCLAASGAVMPEVLAAAALLTEEEVAAVVVDVTSADRLHRGWTATRRRDRRAALPAGDDFHLAAILGPDERRAPIVTVHDAVPHALSWLGSVFGAPTTPIGVEAFGQSGSLPELYRVHDLVPELIANAALAMLAADH
jgi:pyruvate dehydrogenase E1 component